MKKFTRITCVLLCIMAVFISGCAQQKKSDKPYIVGILMALNSDYWHMLESGIINAGVELGVEVSVTGPTSESDITGQIAMVEDAITAGCDGIILAPCDIKAILPVLQRARDRNIPVVLVDAELEDEDLSMRATFIGTSEFEAGQQVGQYVVDNFEPCKVAIIRGLAGVLGHNWRCDGFREVVSANGFEVVTEQPADSERGKAVNVAENILESTPDIKVIYCTNDEMALGAYQAVEGKRRTDIFIIGFDGSPDALKSIKEGKLGSSLAQQPIAMGYKGVESVLTLLGGGTIPPVVFTPVTMVDKSNVDAFEKDLLDQIARAEASVKK